MDLDIRHVPVDKLTTFQESALVGRRDRLDELLVEFEERIKALQSDLEEAQKTREFLQTEHENVVLAIELAKGNIVRVICPACSGTGMKPANVISGHVSKGSAFESTGKAPLTSTTPVIDEMNRCTECKGRRWVTMERFKG